MLSLRLSSFTNPACGSRAVCGKQVVYLKGKTNQLLESCHDFCLLIYYFYLSVFATGSPSKTDEVISSLLVSGNLNGLNIKIWCEGILSVLDLKIKNSQ